MTIEIERVIREHRRSVGNASCSCGKMYTIEASTSMIHAEHAQHVAERLAPLMKPAAANRTLIDAARAYRDAIDAAHEDEHGKPHCAIQCNGVDESSGLEIEKGSRFHEDLIATVERTRSALDCVLSATGEVADGQHAKSKLEQGTNAAVEKYTIQGTPTFVIADTMVRGYVPLAQMEGLLDQARAVE